MNVAPDAKSDLSGKISVESVSASTALTRGEFDKLFADNAGIVSQHDAATD